MSHLINAALVATGMATLLGCTPKPPVQVSVVDDRIYTVTPDTIPVKAGIVVGELAALKITEGIEHDSGKVASPAKLSGTLKLRNTSTDQAVRLIGATFLYVDADGQLIQLEEARTPPAIRFASSRNERLDPGQDATETVNVDFPAEALKLKRLKDIRLELTYLPTAFKQQTVNLAVTIGGQ